MNDFQVKLWTSWTNGGAGIFVFRQNGLNKTDFLIIESIENGNAQLKIVTEEDGRTGHPFISFGLSFMIENGNILGKLQQALSEYGIKAPDKSFVEGKLEATENHLKDLQKLIFESVEES